MDRLRVLVFFLISFNLNFAEDVKPDSLHWKTNSMFDYANEKTDDTDKTDSLTDIILLRSQMIHVPNIAGNSLLKNNPLKRQGLFYSSDKNLKFPPNEECVGFGCCFIPLTGCTMIGHNIFAKDTTKRDTTHVQVSKRKWSFGIGYTGGVCYTGDDLVAAPKEEFDLNPLRWFYWLNSLEASIYYPVTQKSALEIGGGWWWAEIHPDKFENWEFNLFPIFLGYHFSKFALKLKYIFLLAKDPGKVPGSIKAEGEGKGYVFNLEYNTNKYIGLDLNLGWGNYLAKEYYPDQIYERIVNMCFNGIGFSIGYKFNIKGGVK